MRLITLDDMAQLTYEEFACYVEPLAKSFTCGEMISTTFMIHRRGTRDKDWLANVKLKNTLTISSFRCIVYLEDIMRLCRKCKMYLITEDVFRIAVTYAMLHPLFQTQHMNFVTNVNLDFQSMMSGASKASYEFMSDHYRFKNKLQRNVLELVRYHVMILTNDYRDVEEEDFEELVERLREKYILYMEKHHLEAWRASKRWKAKQWLVNEDGFILLEKYTNGLRDDQ